ncbi:Na+/H+ antiporter NhaC [Endozoicomonas montiporae]|uniref:Na+/H+ antiporter n=1 Tax=Endozoicomonas montiporae CL-33 TaxID=570277 RepID=A0A142B8G6_9GAMM|nr:Na+/H+ antiporter NhaC [Endozoicomonas montiporae]AMO55042.1 Na+/H+ antiporter [Endozoicomonas montiporae CL-33]
MAVHSRQPGFFQALLTFGLIVITIGIGLFILQTSLHSLMLLCLLIAGVSARCLGADYYSIKKAMNDGIHGALSAIYIFILIGVIIAAFIESGTLATLLYYGIRLIEPAIFLPAGMLFCTVMSLATGTSWGTVGTAGVVLMSIGESMGFPTAVVAGMIISGASFGDKMSPVSDTTNLSAMTSKTDLYAHIKSMSYTGGPVYLLVLALFTFYGLNYSDSVLPAEHLELLSEGLRSTFSISLWALLPLLAMLVLSVRRVSAELAMAASALVAVLLAVVLQGQAFGVVLNSLFDGGQIRSGVAELDTLLERGGIISMMWTLSLSLIALALGGVLDRFGFLKVLIVGILSRVKRAATLVATTIITSLFGNMGMGEAYMTIILGGQLFGEAYDKKDIDRSVMSRSLEEGATLTTALIPWTTGGAFFASTLGVSVLEYAPWALLNWMNPLLSIVMAYSGFALFRTRRVNRAIMDRRAVS